MVEKVIKTQIKRTKKSEDTRKKLINKHVMKPKLAGIWTKGRFISSKVSRDKTIFHREVGERCGDLVRIYPVHHLESRWRNSHVLVYHGPLLIHLLGVAPSTFTTVYYDGGGPLVFLIRKDCEGVIFGSTSMKSTPAYFHVCLSALRILPFSHTSQTFPMTDDRLHLPSFTLRSK